MSWPSSGGRVLEASPPRCGADLKISGQVRTSRRHPLLRAAGEFCSASRGDRWPAAGPHRHNRPNHADHNDVAGFGNRYT
jgi:hypothetical protein